jgi:hypothetical protein
MCCDEDRGSILDVLLEWYMRLSIPSKMHHPDIADIILTIDDYFLLADSSNSKCQIQSISDGRDEHQPKHGIKISRQLKCGSILAYIWAMNEDDDTVIFQYSRNSTSGTWTTDFEIESSDYSKDSVRSVVRTIIKLDKEEAEKQEQVDLPQQNSILHPPSTDRFTPYTC